MEVINAGMRKGIKIMCVVAQTAQFVSLMPKPQDFVTRIVGDVVYLSSLIQKLSDDMNKLLDSYADIPVNYLMTQMNSITGSLSNITNRINTFAQNGVNQVVGLGENTMDMISEITGTVIDTAGSATNAVVSFGSAVAQTGTNIIGQTDIAEEINDATDVVLEWTGNGFKEFSDNTIEPLNNITQKLTDAKNKATGKIQDTANAVNDKISEAQKWVETLITELRDKMKKLSDIVDGNFKDVTGLSSISKGAQTISEELKVSGDSIVSKKVVEVTTSVTSSLASVIKKFNIGKVVAAFAGVLTQSVIVRLGLDQLPPIDFESMLCKIRDDMTISAEDLYKQYNTLTEDAYRDLEELSKIPTEDRNYSDENYEEFKKQYEEELKKQRDDIRLFMKRTDIDKTAQDTLSKREMISAIKEIKKYRKKIKKAKQATKLKDIIGQELDNFKKEAEYRSNTLKSDWQSMMKQYKDCIAEIKSFFQNGGSCDMFIDDCCNAINKDFDDIKELCKSLISQLIGCSIKIVMPADIGTVVPNPVYKIADFWMDIKTIFKFIKDIITLIIDIINNINKIARLMLNGLNNLKEIIKQLMEILGLKWLMDLVQSIINLFGDNITNSRERLINTLSPVHFSDTEEYENTLEALDEYLENEKLTKEQTGYLNDTVDLLSSISVNDKNVEKLIGKIKDAKNIGKIDTEDKSKQIEELLDDLDERGDVIVAYKSPILKEVGETSDVSTLIDGGSMDNDIKFIGWYFFHPNLEHTKDTYYKTSSGGLISKLINKLLKKIKSKIIKKASKNGHKKKGGVNQLRRKVVGTKKTKIDSAYTAFYWYTYYTEDLEKDCFERGAAENGTFIDSVMRTENGSVVEVTDVNGQTLKVFVADANVRSGDYVTVNGVKYRVR